MVQYRGYGMSFRRQYHHAKKRSEEDPLQNLHLLNVMEMQAKIPVVDGSPDARKEHINHFIDTLDVVLKDRMCLNHFATSILPASTGSFGLDFGYITHGPLTNIFIMIQWHHQRYLRNP